jgi:mRNA interferase MazF
MSFLATWVPDRREIIWINFNPQIGKEMRDMHPMLVLSPKAFNARTGLVIGLPMSTSESNANNPFAVDNSKGLSERSFIICNQPKSLDWRLRGARPHPWERVSISTLKLVCQEVNDIMQLVA